MAQLVGLMIHPNGREMWARESEYHTETPYQVQFTVNTEDNPLTVTMRVDLDDRFITATVLSRDLTILLETLRDLHGDIHFQRNPAGVLK